MPCDVANAINADVWFRLGFLSQADLAAANWLTLAELYQYADDAAQALARTTALFLTHDTSIAVRAGTPTYALPAGHIFTEGAWLNSGGSNFLWMGMPITGVSFSTSLVTVTGLVKQTLVTNPVGSGKRMFVEAYWTNSGVATDYSEWKSDGTHNMPLTLGPAATANGFGLVQYPAMLEPGESFVMACTNTIQVSVGVMSFDLTSPIKSVTVWRALPAGATTLYTVPAGMTAFTLRTQTLTLPFQPANQFLNIYNFDTTPISYQSLVAGVPTLSPVGPYDNTTALNIVLPIFPVLTEGQTVALSLSAANSAAGVTAFYMLVYERPNNETPLASSIRLLRLSTVGQLFALDAVWSTKTGPPTRLSLDAQDAVTAVLYPSPVADSTLNLILEQAPPTVAAGASVLPISPVLEMYFSAAVVAGALSKESDNARPEVAAHLQERLKLLDAVIQSLWGTGR